MTSNFLKNYLYLKFLITILTFYDINFFKNYIATFKVNSKDLSNLKVANVKIRSCFIANKKLEENMYTKYVKL